MVRVWCAVSALTILLLTIQPASAQIQGQWTVTTGPMNSAREFGAQVLLTSNGKVLSIGGIDNNNPPNVLASAEVYSPSTGTWKLTGSMAQARQQFAAVVLKTGKVLVVGGLGASNIVLSGAELYNPLTGTWSSAGSLHVPRFGHTATLLLPSGKVLVTGGCMANTGCSNTATSELYDPTSNSWSKTGSLNTARYYHTAVLLHTGKVLVVGGTNGTALSSCELYNPSTGAWSNAASTATFRYHNGTTLLSDGKVLVTGGASGRFPMYSAEIYDPTANTWKATGSMITPRYAHSATLLGDGTVVVAGGYGQPQGCGKACTTYIPTYKVEVYNEATGTFSKAGALSRALAYQSATLSAQGVALIAGGIGWTSTCCVVVNTSEYYTPLSLNFSASTLPFGFVQVGLTSAAQTVTISNVSNHSVTFSSIAASGDYSQSNNCPATLPVSHSCTISVTFSPTVAGARNGAVTLKDNSPGSPQQTIALSGNGGAGALTFTVASLNLGSVSPPGQTYQYVTLINDSAGTVSGLSFSFAPANGTFSTFGANNCPTTFKPQASCVFQVVFKPPDTGTFSATLTVTDSGKGAPATLALAGTGLD